MKFSRLAAIALLGFSISAFAQTQTIELAPSAPTQTKPLVYVDGAGGIANLVAMQRRGWVPVGYARYAPTTVKTFASACSGTACVTIPASAKHAIILIKTNAVSWRDDGTAPTATEGMLWDAGTRIVIEDSRLWLLAVKFIDTGAGASDVRISYYKSVGE